MIYILQITSFTGYGENLFIGTSTGRLHQYVRENEKWSYRAGLEIPEVDDGENLMINTLTFSPSQSCILLLHRH